MPHGRIGSVPTAGSKLSEKPSVSESGDALWALAPADGAGGGRGTAGGATGTQGTPSPWKPSPRSLSGRLTDAVPLPVKTTTSEPGGFGSASSRSMYRRQAGLAGLHLEIDSGENATGRRAVRHIVRRRFGWAIRRNGGVLGAAVDCADEGGLWPGGLRRDGLRRDKAAVAAALKRQVEEGDVLAGVAVGERREVDVGRPHPAAVVVKARLPADEVLDVLDHEMGGVVVLAVVAGKVRGQAVVNAADGHGVRGVVVAVAARHHVQADPGSLGGLQISRRRNAVGQENKAENRHPPP